MSHSDALPLTANAADAKTLKHSVQAPAFFDGLSWDIWFCVPTRLADGYGRLNCYGSFLDSGGAAPVESRTIKVALNRMAVTPCPSSLGMYSLVIYLLSGGGLDSLDYLLEGELLNWKEKAFYQEVSKDMPDSTASVSLNLFFQT